MYKPLFAFISGLDAVLAKVAPESECGGGGGDGGGGGGRVEALLAMTTEDNVDKQGGNETTKRTKHDGRVLDYVEWRRWCTLMKLIVDEGETYYMR